MKHWSSECTNPWINGSENRRFSETMNQWIHGSMILWISESMKQRSNESTNQSRNNAAMNQSINDSTNQWANESVDPWISRNQWTNAWMDGWMEGWMSKVLLCTSSLTCVLFVDNFSRSSREPAETESFLPQSQEPHCLKKTQGFAPKSVSTCELTLSRAQECFHLWAHAFPNCFTLPNYLMMMWLAWGWG